MPPVNEGLLNRVARRLSEPPKYSAAKDSESVLSLAATAYGSGLSEPNEENEEQTIPTGFDPQAAALFEAVVESAFLVAHADGEFDTIETDTFKSVVVSACKGKVTEAQVDALVADFADQLREDGMDKRIEMVGRIITRPEHASEVLRIAGLLAAVSAGISHEERSVLERLAAQFKVGDAVLADALAEVEGALAN